MLTNEFYLKKKFPGISASFSKIFSFKPIQLLVLKTEEHFIQIFTIQDQNHFTSSRKLLEQKQLPRDVVLQYLVSKRSGFT